MSDTTHPDFAAFISRRAALKAGVGAGLAALMAPREVMALQHGVLTPLAPVADSQGALITRRIPSSGELLPVIGIGTARRYDVSTPEEKAPLRDTLREFPRLGGKVIDTAPGYGQAESVTGELVSELGIREQLFLATKVSVRGTDAAPGVAQMEESFRRLKTDRIDLMQVWNLQGPATLLPVLREMKAAKRIRYVGVTTSSDQQYPQLEQLMQSEALDFIQIDYAADNRNAAERILPLAREKGIGVLVNLPFGRTRVFQNVLQTPVPEWAKEFDAATWAQLFLKYIVANPAVTCVIPGTAQVKYVNDNTLGMRGGLPTAEHLKRIEALVQRAM
jgi:aryl-alcohol dehydrogenase-like predicted oxidoreductase